MPDLPENTEVKIDPAFLRTPILIVDDLQDNIDLLEDMLQDAGFTSISHTRSGEAALALLEKTSDFGLILLDLMMPVLDGCETCQRITSRPETNHIPVIMVTGGSVQRDEALLRSFDAGAVDFITKPLQEVELYGRIRAALGLYHERISSREKTLALQQSEERFELAVSGVNEGIWDINLLTGEAYLSPKWKNILGYKENELLDSMEVWEKFIHPADRERVNAALSRHWHDKTSIYVAEYRMQTKDGDYKWVLSRGKTIWDEFDRTVRMAGSTTDITNQKSLEDQLRHIQKMESIGRFAGGIAHDFNNVIALISAYSQVILEQPRLAPTVEKYSKEILNATEHAATVTRQLLSFSRRSDIDLKPTNLNDIIFPMGEMIDRIVGKEIQYHQDLDPDVSPILADKNMIEQLILNLAINARDAMASGQLRIATRSCEITAEECLVNNEAIQGLATQLQISDTGFGMDEETLAQIFEPFFTTKSDGKGTGLGLSTAYSVVKQHKGWITVKSEVDKGTTFKVFFPVLKESDPISSSTPDSPPTGRGETILLVEDENALREMATTILTGYNYHVLSASSGPEAIDLWATHKDSIAMLFTDIVMPHGYSGIDIGERFYKERPSLKIIYTSGYRLDAIPRSMKMKESGIFIPKPYIPSALAKLIRDTLDR